MCLSLSLPQVRPSMCSMHRLNFLGCSLFLEMSKHSPGHGHPSHPHQEARGGAQRVPLGSGVQTSPLTLGPESPLWTPQLSIQNQATDTNHGMMFTKPFEMEDIIQMLHYKDQYCKFLGLPLPPPQYVCSRIYLAWSIVQLINMLLFYDFKNFADII